MKKKSVLITASYLVEIPEEEINRDFGMLDKIEQEMSEDRILSLGEQEVTARWISSTRLVLDPADCNCGQCSNCGQWTTDREKPNSITSLCNGATVNGKLFCDDCLPKDHEWSF